MSSPPWKGGAGGGSARGEVDARIRPTHPRPLPFREGRQRSERKASMIYDIRHVTRFDYGARVKFARCNLRLKPIHWSGQNLLDYRLTISPSGRVAPARAEAGLANVMRMVVEQPVRHLMIESVSRIEIDRPVPMPSNGSPPLREIAAAARVSRDPSPAGPAAYLFPSPLIPLDRDIAEWCAADLHPDRPALDAAI